MIIAKVARRFLRSWSAVMLTEMFYSIHKTAPRPSGNFLSSAEEFQMIGYLVSSGVVIRYCIDYPVMRGHT
jgi:hypothetical protein